MGPRGWRRFRINSPGPRPQSVGTAPPPPPRPEAKAKIRAESPRHRVPRAPPTPCRPLSSGSPTPPPPNPGTQPSPLRPAAPPADGAPSGAVHFLASIVRMCPAGVHPPGSGWGWAIDLFVHSSVRPSSVRQSTHPSIHSYVPSGHCARSGTPRGEQIPLGHCQTESDSMCFAHGYDLKQEKG